MASPMTSSSYRFARRGDEVAPKRFPLVLGRAVLMDLLTKELDAHLFPADEAKLAAFAAARESLPGRVALLMSKIGVVYPAGVDDDFCLLVRDLWKLIFEHPCLSKIQPSVLQSSLWLETLTSVFKGTCAAAGQAKGQLLKGGALVASVLFAIETSSTPFATTPPDVVTHLLALVEWWSDEVCCKRWGVKDAWGPYVVGGTPGHAMNIVIAQGLPESPMNIIAAKGLAAFVPLAVKRGCPMDGDFDSNGEEAPAAVAVRAGHADVAEALLAHGVNLTRRYEVNACPLALTLFSLYKAPNLQFLSDLLRARPEIAKLRGTYTDFLDSVIRHGDAGLLELALAAGAEVQYESRWDFGLPTARPLLASVLDLGNPNILRVLMTKAGILEGWRDKYDKGALRDIADSLARLAISAYPSNPHYKGSPNDLIRHNPKAMECLDMVLGSGIVCSWGRNGKNALLAALYSLSRDEQFRGCLLDEKDALALLQRYQSAGFDVLSFQKDSWLELPHAAIALKQPDVLEWCFSKLGVSPHPGDGEDFVISDALLTGALLRCSVQCALMLLRRYNAKAAYAEQQLRDQPVVAFLRVCGLYSGEDATEVLEALVARDPSLFGAEYFSERAVAEHEDTFRDDSESIFAWNPLVALVHFDRFDLLETLLKKEIPGVKAMANRTVLYQRHRVSPAQFAAMKRQWKYLELLLHHTDARVTDSATVRVLCAAELVSRADGTEDGPSRALVAAVKARAQKELTEKAEKAETAAASQAAGAITNAFEDPSSKLLTEKEARAKAKKKAAKKKARARKRATANAGAGSAMPAADGDDDSSSDADDEDVRYAPDFDALRAQMEAAMKKE